MAVEVVDAEQRHLGELRLLRAVVVVIVRERGRGDEQRGDEHRRQRQKLLHFPPFPLDS
jgi:hypothetical protein